MAITKDIVSDYSADNTGVADAAPAFYTDLKADMVGEDCNLTIPAGTYRFASTPGSFFWASGMTSLVVTATGATLEQDTGGAVVLGSLNMTQIGIDEASGKSARIRTVSAGANTVQLTAASASAGHISRATVGQWMMVTGFDTQGIFRSAYGFPPNAHFVEFAQITDVGADTISFTPALRDSYSDEWPEFNRGNAFEVDSAGPATVYFLHPDWDHITVFNGPTLSNADNIKCEGKDFTIEGGGSDGGLPVYPSVNRIWRAIDHDTSTSGEMELDKLVDTAIFDGGASHQFKCQSSSVYTWLLSNTTMDGGVLGTARNTVIDNCVIGGQLLVGPTTHGCAETFVCRNTSIAGTIGGGRINRGPDAVGFNSYATMASGIITIPMCFGSDGGANSLVPDALGRNSYFWMGDSDRTLGSFKVLSVTSDPWPATDNQSTTTNVTINSASNILQVSSSIFQSSDVGKVIIVDNGRSGPAQMRSVITQFDSATQVRIFHNFTNTLSASSQTVQWGTCNYYIHTDQSGGFPSSSLYSVGGVLSIMVPPARTVFFENCTGSATAVDLSQPAARNRPMWSYSKRTYDGTTFGATGSTNYVIGNITSIKINVITAYTGTRPTLTVGLSQFDNLSVIVGGALTTYGPRVNLKIAGERIITVGNTTGTQSGDTNLNISSATWICREHRVSVSQDITGESSSVYPSFTVEIITDQGIYSLPTAVAPFRSRLRA